MSDFPSARINLGALRHNLLQARRAAPQSRVMAVIKADGYGHGMSAVAAALAGNADALAVARLDEGVTLREAGIHARIVVLGGALASEDMRACAEHALEPVLHEVRHVDLLAAHATSLTCWLKVNTGMNRLGMPPSVLPMQLERLRAMRGVQLAGLMTHFACADERACAETKAQLQCFDQTTASLEIQRSAANSAAVLGFAESHLDWNRPGLMLFGASPFADEAGASLGLLPVMTLQSRLIAVNEVGAGDAIGYGATWRAPEAMRIGVVAIGYGDGYPREFQRPPAVLVGERLAPLVGRVSMDMITIDLRGLDDAQVGDEVTLWGEGLPIEEVAAAVGTIPYTLMCGVAARVRRHYVEAASELAVGQ